MSKDQNQKIEQLTKQMPALGKIPYEDRLTVFKSAFRSVPYRIFLFAIFVAFVLVFYFNLDNILEYKGVWVEANSYAFKDTTIPYHVIFSWF